MDFQEIMRKSQIEDDKEHYLEGKLNPQRTIKRPLPPKGKIKSYLLTSAQNNTIVIEQLLKNMKVLARHLNAEIIVAPLNYKKNMLNTAGERVATEKGGGLTFDSLIQEYLTMDRIELSHEVVFYGDMGFGITARNPLSSIERMVTNHKIIIPSNKIQMESVPQSSERNIRFHLNINSTPTLTALNFIDSKTGKISEYEADFGAILVQVDHEGIAFIYQIEANKKDYSIYFRNLSVKNGILSQNSRPEAIVFGDIHAVNLTEQKVKSIWGVGGLVNSLNPRYQVMHDVLDQYACNHHHEGDDILGFVKHHSKTNNLHEELKQLGEFLNLASVYSKVIVVESNHDNALMRYLKRVDVRKDYENSVIASKMLSDLIVYTAYMQNLPFEPQSYSMEVATKIGLYKKLHEFSEIKKSSMFIEYVMKYYFDVEYESVLFLSTDDELDFEGVFIPYHGDKGVNGSRGSASLRKVPSKMVYGHSHSSHIRGKQWCVGVTSDIENFDYISGASSWSPSHCLIHEGGSRCMLLERNGKYYHDCSF